MGIRKEKRIGGRDRYETSKLVSQKFNSPKVSIASGEVFPDSLCGGIYSGRNNMPVLLTKKNIIPNSVGKLIVEKNFKDMYIYGGNNSVSEKAKMDLMKLTNGKITIKRIAGRDRFGTAVEISKLLFK